MKLTAAGKVVILLVVAGAAFGGYRLWHQGSNGSTTGSSGGDDKPVKVEGDLGLNKGLGRQLVVAMNQWPGWLGGIFANGGLKPSRASIYWQKYNLLVEFKVMDDPVAMMTAFGKGDIDVAWSTMDQAATQLGGLKKGGAPAKVLFQVDYSQGGDAIVAKPGIERFEDLAGKTVALIPMSPSDTLLRYGVLNSSLTESQKKGILTGEVQQDDPNKVVSTFVAGKADAIVTWEPNITAAINKVPGAKVIFSSETAANLIGDCFLAHDDFIAQHGDLLKAFIQGWFDGAYQAQANSRQAVTYMMDSFPDFKSLGEAGCLATFNKVKITNLADNAKTFGLGGGTPLFNTIYSQANSFYADVVQDQLSPREAMDPEFVNAIFQAQAPDVRKVTPPEEFHPTEKQREKAKGTPPVFTKPLSIQFATGSSSLSASAKQMLDSKVAPLLQTASNAFFRIEGNTDNVGSHDSNIALSQRRATAVVQYLESKGFNSERLFAVGNGPDKPVASNGTAQGKAANRRTDIKVVANQ